MDKQTKTLTGPRGVQLILDRTQVFPDDPGNGTPAIVLYRTGSATYWCAVNEGQVDAHEGTIRLPQSVLDWLDSKETELEQFLYQK